MIKLDNSIIEDIQSDDEKAYWKDFDEGRAAFTMEVNDSMQDDDINDDINDLLNLMEV